MYSYDQKEITESIASLISESLEKGESVSLAGLGTFSVQYRPSHSEIDAEGQQLLHPPKDIVIFSPES